MSNSAKNVNMAQKFPKIFQNYQYAKVFDIKKGFILHVKMNRLACFGPIRVLASDRNETILKSEGGFFDPFPCCCSCRSLKLKTLESK